MPRADTAIRIADYFNVSVKWLVLGVDDPDLRQDERLLLEAYNSLDSTGRGLAYSQTKGLYAHFPLPQEAGEYTETA